MNRPSHIQSIPGLEKPPGIGSLATIEDFGTDHSKNELIIALLFSFHFPNFPESSDPEVIQKSVPRLGGNFDLRSPDCRLLKQDFPYGVRDITNEALGKHSVDFGFGFPYGIILPFRDTRTNKEDMRVSSAPVSLLASRELVATVEEDFANDLSLRPVDEVVEDLGAQILSMENKGHNPLSAQTELFFLGEAEKWAIGAIDSLRRKSSGQDEGHRSGPAVARTADDYLALTDALATG